MDDDNSAAALKQVRKMLRQSYADALKRKDVDQLLDTARAAHRTGRSSESEANSEDQAKVAASLIRLGEYAARAAANAMRTLHRDTASGERHASSRQPFV